MQVCSQEHCPQVVPGIVEKRKWRHGLDKLLSATPFLYAFAAIERNEE